MRSENWKDFGTHLVANAEILEAICQTDEEGVPKPERMTIGLAWLISQRLVDECDGYLHPSSMLLDMGARIGAQRFELSSPDLQELLIRIEQGCARYHSAKDNSASDIEREHRQIWLAARQVITHLRDELRSATDFIESRYGYSANFKDRMRDIESASGRLARLSAKLLAFEHNTLLAWCRGDRALRRLLLTNLYEAINSCKTGILDLIARLDRLGSAMRKRNRHRRVARSVFAWLQNGNSADLEGILDRSDAQRWVRAATLGNQGYLYPPVEDAKALAEMASLVQALPLPKFRRPLLEPQLNHDPVLVVRGEPEIEDAPVPFVQPHFQKMLVALKRDLAPQSACSYWRDNAEGGFQDAVWLYALDAFYHTLIADSEIKSQLPRFILEPILASDSHLFDNQVVVDLVLRTRKRGEVS